MASLLKRGRLPSTDAVGRGLRRMGEEAGLGGLSRLNQRIVAARIRQSGVTEHTLDCAAS